MVPLTFRIAFAANGKDKHFIEWDPAFGIDLKVSRRQGADAPRSPAYPRTQRRAASVSSLSTLREVITGLFLTAFDCPLRRVVGPQSIGRSSFSSLAILRSFS